jgi:hypothetical protein
VSVDEVSVEPRPEWPLQITSDGSIMASIFQLEAPSCVVGCVLRHREYSRTGTERWRGKREKAV